MTEGGAANSADAVPEATAAPQAPPEPQNSYALFREMLKHPSAQPVIQQIRAFVNRFPPSLPRQDAAQRIHKFLNNTQEWMLSESVVFAAEADEDGRTNAAEGLEKFIVCKLYPKLFAAEAGDEEEDARLQRHIAGFRWVDLSHLGLAESLEDPSVLELAASELRRMDQYKAPRDKLVCILNACRVINDVLRRSRADHGRPLSADDFLPLLIYSLLKANPPRLHSNLEFVSAFRHPSRLIMEDAYMFTALQSALQFAKDAGPGQLDVTAEEFERLCGSNREAFDAEVAAASASAAAAAEDAAPAPAATLEARAEELGIEQRQDLATKVKALPLLFESIESGQRLKVKDVPALLEEYKEMARLLRSLDCRTVAG